VTAEGEEAEALFLGAMADLRRTYRSQTFWVERDVVCHVRRWVTDRLPGGMSIFNDFGLMPGPRRARSADLAICDHGGPLVAAEFKFEPAAARLDIKANKLPVIAWSDYEKDIDRITEFVGAGAVPVAWAVCVDEGGRYAARSRRLDSQLEHWDTGYGIQVTLTRISSSE
jgi:hypothetical protein